MTSKVRAIAVLSALLIMLFSTDIKATFSIVAVDTVTGAVGGAGASCISGAQIINDIIEGIGAVHTQAWWLSANQVNAHNLLAAGLTPDSIIAWLDANDVQGRPDKRQYGVVTMVGPGSSASYTGTSNSPWAGHITEPGYAIQGNILLGPQIVSDMESAFLTTPGPLEDKLMAALQAAKVVGADTRCFGLGKSSISAFIKVVHLGDSGDPYLYEVVNNTSGSTDPIDLLQIQYDNWKAATQQANADNSTVAPSHDTLRANGSDAVEIVVTPLNAEGEAPSTGSSVSFTNSGPGSLSSVIDNGDGTFSTTLTATAAPGLDIVSASVDAGGNVVALNQQPEITFYICGDSDNSLEEVTIVDLMFFVAYLFQGGSPPPILQSCNLDGSSEPGSNINVADLTYFVAFLFGGGPPPICE